MRNTLFISREGSKGKSENFWHVYDGDAQTGRCWISDAPSVMPLWERTQYNSLKTPQCLFYLSNGKGGGTVCYINQTEKFNDGKSGVMLSVGLPCKTATADRAAEYIGCDMPDCLRQIFTAEDVQRLLSDPDPDTWFQVGRNFPESMCSMQTFKTMALCVLDALIARKREGGKPVLLVAERERPEEAMIALKTALRDLPASLRTRVSFLTNATTVGDLTRLNVDIACALPQYADAFGADQVRKINVSTRGSVAPDLLSCYCHCLNMGLAVEQFCAIEDFTELERMSCFKLLEENKLFLALDTQNILKPISEGASLETFKQNGEKWYNVRNMIKQKLGKDLTGNNKAKTYFNSECKRCLFEPGIRIICRENNYPKPDKIITLFVQRKEGIPNTLQGFIATVEDLINGERGVVADLLAEDSGETGTDAFKITTEMQSSGVFQEANEAKRESNKRELKSGRAEYLKRLARYANRMELTEGVEKIYYDATAGKAAARSKWKFRLKHYLFDICFLVLTLFLLLAFRPILQSIEVGEMDPLGSWDALAQTLGLMGRGWECLLLSWNISIVGIPVFPVGIIMMTAVLVAGGYGLYCGETMGFVFRRILAFAFVIALFWALLLIILMSVYVW